MNRCICTAAAIILGQGLVLAQGNQDYRIERLDPRADQLIPADAQVEQLASGFRWSEGPVWIGAGDYLLFSDVPNNRIHRWSDEDGLSLWLEPSGYTGSEPRTAGIGSNGLTLDRDGRLIMAQHGDRRVVRYAGEMDRATPEFETLADKWDGQRFNSPNDLVFDTLGNLYFTDPPYGLDGRFDDPAREIDFQGVYRLNIDGSVDLIDDQNRMPNGVAISPDGKTLYVTNSDPKEKLLVAYDIAADGSVENRRVLVDMTELGDGNPDGLKVDVEGNIWTSGPGGVRVFSADGAPIAAIHLGRCANVGWGDDGSTLYATAGSNLVRLRTSARGYSPFGD